MPPTDRELMQMALDALEEACEIVGNAWAWRDEKGRTAAETLRARLAQPEPEPVAWVAYENGEKHGIDFDEDEIAELPVGTMLYTAPPQEPQIKQRTGDCLLTGVCAAEGHRIQKPQREWQDLTDDESDEIWGECLGVFDCLKMTQAKLKEKNT